MGLCADSQWRAKSAQPADGRFGSADRHQSWGGLRHVNHVTEGPDIEWASAALDGCVCEACGHVGANHAPPMRWRPAWTLGATIQSDLSSDAPEFDTKQRNALIRIARTPRRATTAG